ncbi:sodium channel and clathrin linker 1-like [Palaemon carinicauda]|uniref:sodium channel and clathrin linker 1-like n=1 Tax=Palaemon carinicauda TaxID=392227 RepID=UPI0035B5FFA3
MERENLLQEYEETVHKQATLLKRQQSTIESLREELSHLQGKLLSTGKQHQSKIEALIQQIHSAEFQDTSDENLALKQELESALKEKELCQAENKRQALEVQRLRQEVISKPVASGETFQLPVHQLQEYENVVRALEEETQRLRAGMIRLEDEKLEAFKQNIDLKKKVDVFTFELEQFRKEISLLKAEDQEKEISSQELRESYFNLKKQFADQSEDLRVLLLQTKSLQKNKDYLSKVLGTVNDRLEDAKQRVAESVQIAEDSLVEKDAALLREKHALDEVSRLESTVSSLMEEMGGKAQAEVLKIKDDYNSNIKKLSQEVVRLEMALNGKQLECNRNAKDKEKIGNELEQMKTEFSKKKEEHREEILNLHQRISSQENRIVTLLNEKDNSFAAYGLNIKDHEEQREELLSRIQELENHLVLSRGDCESLRIIHEELKREYQIAVTNFKRLEEESEANDKFLKRQLRVKSEELEEVTSSSSIRLDAVDASSKGIIKQLNENIEALQGSYSKLQSQVECQKNDYEERIAEINQRLQDSVFKYKNAIQSVHETKAELAIAKDMSSQYSNRIGELEARLRAAEQRYATIKKSNTQIGNSSSVL